MKGIGNVLLYLGCLGMIDNWLGVVHSDDTFSFLLYLSRCCPGLRRRNNSNRNGVSDRPRSAQEAQGLRKSAHLKDIG